MRRGWMKQEEEGRGDLAKEIKKWAGSMAKKADFK